MYEVFLKNWYQESPNNIIDAWVYLKTHAENYIENYPIVEMGVREQSNILK
jgi:hypothetical protein